MTSPPLLQSRDFLDEYIGNRLINTAIAFMCIEAFLVTLRFLSRRLQRTPLSWEDYLMIPALIFCYGNCILGILAVQHGGVGRHYQYVKQFPEKIAYWYKSCLIATPVIYVIAACLPKVTILGVYLRIFVEKWSRVACYVLMFMVIANVVGNIPSLIYKCDPLSYGWDPTTPGGWCADSDERFRYSSLFNIVTDVGMLALPVPLIWKLHTTKSTKFGLACIFATGSVGLITSIMRFVAFFATESLKDGTWASVDLVQWCIIEPGVYLIAACLIAYRPLLLYLFKDTPISTLLTRTQKSLGLSSGPSRYPKRGLANRADVEGQFDTSRRAKSDTYSSSDRKALIEPYNGSYFAEASANENGRHARGSGDASNDIHLEQEFVLSVNIKKPPPAPSRF